MEDRGGGRDKEEGIEEGEEEGMEDRGGGDGG